MNAVAQIVAEPTADLLVTLERARALLDDGDLAAARLIAGVAYDQAKAAAGSAEKVKASRQLIDKARRMQADALFIETHATIRMADAVDEAQARGQVARPGRKSNISGDNIFTLDEVGLDAQHLHQARKVRNAERAEPGFVDRVISVRLSEGLEPSRASLKKAAGHAIGTKTATKDERGEDLYETPIEAMRTLLALESFSGGVLEPSVGKGAILRPLEDAGYAVMISDLVDRGIATRHGELQQVGDFLLSTGPSKLWSVGRDIVTNPPYGVANAYAAHALREHRPGKMALLLNWNFAAGFEDVDRCFVMDECPPSRIYVFTRRLPMMHRDGWDGPKASSQMNCAWFVWERNHEGSYGDGYPQMIRVDWKAYEAAEPLAPGTGGHVAPIGFKPGVDEFARETPRKSVEERVGEDLDDAIAFASGRDSLSVAELRKGLGIRNSVAEALMAAMIKRGMFHTAADYERTRPSTTLLDAESTSDALAKPMGERAC
ncbi:hypothetical protein [Rhizobium halophytocola]|uniref:SAM-dependent methyltransferase n=1 Tax=Rhizobium halophytocola TaxID=735519 RepID=A0ABS4DXV8_9HYPH|nr:hypothetical protein [Rhizobium halophytocola]MBP1850529.1 hypothetical protein [Rhizobium halophytocola]